MSLQGYVHQLRPRKESYANHVERLQILTEQLDGGNVIKRGNFRTEQFYHLNKIILN